MDSDVKKILDKYKKKLEKNVGSVGDYKPREGFSEEYDIFRKEALTKKLSLYETLCNFSEKIITIKPKDKDYNKLAESINVAHLRITPYGATGFSMLITFILIIFGLLVAAISLLNAGDFDLNLLLLPMVIFLVAILLLKPISHIPNYSASRWRLRVSNQMVLCILYVVMYMRHTSNLEHAIKFAADHIGDPLALDLRKVFWDVEVGNYSSIKQSLDSYLLTWRKYNLEFVEAFHLIEGSLYTSNEDRRITLLEKALDVILNGTYEKMLHYAHELKNPITILHMLGVVLPILGLVILPLIGSLMGGTGLTKIIVLFIIYNIVLPIVVYFIGMSVLVKRPTGYSERDLLQDYPEFKEYRNVNILGVSMNPIYLSIIVFCIFALIGLFPLIMYGLGADFNFLGNQFLDFKQGNGLACSAGNECYGPFGSGSVILGLFLPFGLALSVGLYFRLRTKKLYKIRQETKKLELEFSGGLFQLGNRIGDGIPVEVGFGDVAKSMSGTPTGDFFRLVSNNLTKFGMGVRQAIFDLKRGAIWNYPSTIIESSMEVLIESSKKGPKIVSKSLISISTYLDRIHQVNERLKDLL
ncbi:hypothetical protein K8R47_02040, partial [archaeon]|nr:hypothetical protein [archaeon]